MRSVVLAIGALLAACSDPPRDADSRQGRPPMPPAVEHDFGVIPHQEVREHDYVLDVNSLGATFVPLRAALDCSCGRTELRIRGADGKERGVDGSPAAANAVGPHEQLVVHVTLDTVNKESIDLPTTTSRGTVTLQPVDDATGHRRVQWPILVRYGIDSPVVVEPFAALDFGRVPVSHEPELRTHIQGDEHHRGMKFLDAISSDPAITVRLEPDGDRTTLFARCRPGEAGHHRAFVAVHTDSPTGYRVNFAVTWKVVADLEATPSAKISFRTDLSRAQRADEAQSQFVVVTDHDDKRPAEFAVDRIVDADGRDAGASFVAELVPVPGQARQHRLFVRYAGGRTETFRGQLVLTKHGAEGPFLAIELVVFSSRDS